MSVALGVAEVHPQQLGREELGLVAARSGPDLQDHVLLVVGVARQQLERAAPLAARLRGPRAGGPRPGPGRASPRRPSRASPGPRPAPCGPPGARARRSRPARAAASSLPRRLSAAGSERRLGSGQLGLRASYWAGDLDELGVDHGAASGGLRRASPALPCDGAARPPRDRESTAGPRTGAARRDLAAVCQQRPLERDDGDFDHVVARAGGW